MGKSLEALASELGIEAEKTDDDEEEETGHRAKKGRSEYSPSRCSSRAETEGEKNSEEKTPELSTRNNKLVPPEKEKKEEEQERRPAQNAKSQE